jgi:hypothetical protein
MEMTTPVFSAPRTTSGTNSSGASMQFVIEKKMGGEQWPNLALPAVVCFWRLLWWLIGSALHDASAVTLSGRAFTPARHWTRGA